MAGTRHAYVNEDYRIWSEHAVGVAGQSLVLASKPGVFSHGSVDPASRLIAEHVKAKHGDVVVQMNGGNALLGAALHAQGKGVRVVMADRNVLAIEASRRTMNANGVENSGIHLGHGRLALPDDLKADVVAIRIPTDKLSLIQLLNDAHSLLKEGGACYIAGATNEGIKSAARIVEELFGNAVTVATDAGHRIVRAMKRDDRTVASDETFHAQVLNLRDNDLTFFSRAGVFSWDHLDEATEILLEHMDVRATDRVLDIGCGYGVLGVTAGSIATEHPVTMLDVDSEAVRSATRSAHAAGLANARVLPSDIAAAVLDEKFDLVVTNPPFHVGKSTDLSVPVQFIYDAWKVLAPGGRLNLVANRTLPYEGAIKHLFRNITTVHDGRRFKVLAATKE